MKRIIAFTLLIASVAAEGFAAPRSEKAAREIAAQFLCSKNMAKGKQVNGTQLTLAATGTSLLGVAKSKGQGADAESLYIYNVGNEAFAIVSGDDAVEPILAYSMDGTFCTENVPEHIRQWLQTYVDEQNYYTNNAGSQRAFATATTQSAYPNSVAPILKSNGELIQWDQSAPFNDDCPNYMGSRSAAGCVATALAQIMYYHRWPEKAQGGSKSYLTATYGIADDFTFTGTTFDYGKMLPYYYKGLYTEEQGAEAAKLTHAVGVAVDMDYAPEGSGAHSMDIGNAFVKYFNYDRNIHYVMRDYFTLGEWLDMIKGEISAGRPICYAGTSASIGHQFVIDGYGGNGMVHINWGWAGMSDGYFRLSVLAPSAVGIGGGSVTSGGFVFNQGMWLGMQRPTEGTEPVSFYITEAANMTADKTSLLTGERISCGLPNFYNASTDFDGAIGLVLTTEDGTQYVLDQKPEKRSCGYGMGSNTGNVIEMSGAMPEGLDDGMHTLAFATKATSEPRWSRIRSRDGFNDRYLVKAEGGKLTLTQAVQLPDAIGTLSSDHTIYTRCRCQFTAKLTNTTPSEYFGIAHVGIYTMEGDSPKLIALCGENQVSLPVGEETEVVFKASIEGYNGNAVERGDYKACVLLEHQDKFYMVGEEIDVTINRIPSGMANLVADEFSVEDTELALNESLCGNINVTNMQSVYSGNVGIIIFKKGSNSGKAYWEKEVFLEKGTSASMSYDIPVQWSAGEYKAELRYNESYTNVIKSVDFVVKDEYAAINNVTADNADVPVTYYSISGKRLSSAPKHGLYLVRHGNKTVCVNNK